MPQSDEERAFDALAACPLPANLRSRSFGGEWYCPNCGYTTTRTAAELQER